MSDQARRALLPERARGALLAWGAVHRRALPWRDTRDPWGILVSEVMLQQTQVARVVERWPRFVRRWPTPGAFATATLGEVLREWQGLGYPRRARNLHAAATQMVERHDGIVPGDLGELLELPGVGAYTARAVRVFAHEFDDAVLDTNVGRILARLSGGRLTSSEAQSLADAAVPTGGGWEWNQTVLDLGATVCTKRSPRCGECPMSAWCAWWSAGNPDPDPAVSSAAVSGRQGSFEGSDRQLRGRVLRQLATGPVPRLAVVEVLGVAVERAENVIDGLIADGLIAATDAALALPGDALSSR